MYGNNHLSKFYTFCVLAAEKQLVDEVFSNAMDVLSDDDRHLPQVENLLPLLRRGILLQ